MTDFAPLQYKEALIFLGTAGVVVPLFRRLKVSPVLGFLGAGILRRVRAGYALAFCAIAAAILVTVSMVAGGYTAMWTMLAVGLFNSIMFPTIFSLGEAELGPLTGTGSGLLNMAIVGGAIVPLLVGVMADHVGLRHAFVIPVICYLYILYYGLRGSRPNSERFAMRP
jgi:MFS transporter, FHS family, L-fucose permease